MVNIFTLVNKKKTWNIRYLNKNRYRVKQDLIFSVENGKQLQKDLIFTVVNQKKIWKDRYRGKHLYRGKQEKDLERSLPW